jgi:O-6-methylguanine DNA methyltransferase
MTFFMKKQNTYNDQTRWTIYKSPIDDIVIAGDDFSIQLISFEYSFHKYLAPLAGIKRGITSQIEKVISYLDIYFSDEQKEIPYKLKIISAPSLKQSAVKEDVINLDCSVFTENEIAVYRKLITVRAGRTISYGILAEKAGLAKAGRFAGTTMAKNLFPILIPCHRVVKSGGKIGHYSGGPGKKEFLLKHEGYL